MVATRPGPVKAAGDVGHARVTCKHARSGQVPAGVGVEPGRLRTGEEGDG